MNLPNYQNLQSMITTMTQQPTLPRELIDNIITTLISLHSHDPAYQWTHLRHITRHHKAHLEQHFLTHWVPKLSFQIPHYHSSCPYVEFTAPAQPRTLQKDDSRNDGADIVVFTESHGLRLSDVPNCWYEEATGNNERHPWEQIDSNVVVYFGEGTLNKGYSKGGVRNDVVIPNLSINTDSWPWEFSFGWKELFTRLFTEEMVTRTFRDKLLEWFVPTLGADVGSEIKEAAVHNYLRNHFYWQRRAVLAAYRKYKYPLLWEEGHCRNHYREHVDGRCYKAYTPKRAFDFSPFVYQGGEKLDFNFYDNFYIFEDEESMVFQIPGWETWDVGDIGRLRVYEEMVEGRQFPDEWFGYPDGRLGDYWELYYEDLLQDMEGRRTVSDEVLEGRLRAEKLDPETFWLS
ncbi:hypothetical protein BKA58DRAFT_406715 [Alternaria rosae]|uniref:uncharacterized protein n=1 Tax=Alternaria rosae TaxID=1187941 RepID=UPI001E8E5AB3|nr:uncharacterized protein BKA58DRAFT_406715 [Alternaria rosae]KAH6848497.1 hypothetical protein BKA58DRAFT_406715 [Alternaria rosae]